MHKLVNAYLNTVYRVRLASGWASIRIGQPVQIGDAVLTTQNWVIITACNPGSIPLINAHNFARHRLFTRELDHIGWPRHPTQAVPDAGQPHWPAEYGWLVIATPAAQLYPLARAFGQLAVVTCMSGHAPRLCIMRGLYSITINDKHPYLDFA